MESNVEEEKRMEKQGTLVHRSISRFRVYVRNKDTSVRKEMGYDTNFPPKTDTEYSLVDY